MPFLTRSQRIALGTRIARDLASNLRFDLGDPPQRDLVKHSASYPAFTYILGGKALAGQCYRVRLPPRAAARALPLHQQFIDRRGARLPQRVAQLLHYKACHRQALTADQFVDW